MKTLVILRLKREAKVISYVNLRPNNPLNIYLNVPHSHNKQSTPNRLS